MRSLSEVAKSMNGKFEIAINWTWIYFEDLDDANMFANHCDFNQYDYRDVITPWRADQDWKFAVLVHNET
jgi:hypothetical protein